MVHNIFHKDVAISIFIMPKVMVLPEGNSLWIPQFVISHGILLFSPSSSLGRVNHCHLQCDFSRSSSYTLLQTFRIISHRVVLKNHNSVMTSFLTKSDSLISLFLFSYHKSACEVGNVIAHSPNKSECFSKKPNQCIHIFFPLLYIYKLHQMSICWKQQSKKSTMISQETP